jgi:hypothetical protein
MHKDFTQDDLGVRVYANDCTVIERKPGVVGWVEGRPKIPAAFARRVRHRPDYSGKPGSSRVQSVRQPQCRQQSTSVAY